ncbi:MAG: acetate uptake transporter [Chitinispirillaceae bacterium]|jgi:succinate-acetate transporter protein
MNDATSLEIKDSTANPAPLGLFGFGMTTVLLNIHNAGFFEMNSMILAMGIFYGGMCQIIAGIMEWKKKNTFGLVAFTSYGAFWLTLVALLIMPKLGWIDKSSNTGMICYLVMWGIFTFLLFIGTLKLNVALQVVFGSLTLLFFLLAIGDATGSIGLKHFTGFEGIVCGASAMYAGIAQVLNEVYGRTVLPLCPVKK